MNSATSRWPLVFAGLSAALAVFLAAGAAHDLKQWLGTEELARIHTAVRYQVWHALALLGTAALTAVKPTAWLRVAAYGFALGSVLFCGGLYMMSFTGIAIFGWLAPLGGLAFLTGWLALAGHGWRGLKT
ncbi:MAG: DUF423 domain-containing protein [Alphaproteobacteria bacterium]|jgi:uncharacterized membrane protein YgdD (TMEM256/DUF423 family)|nr:hypothetical protein [Rhodospirillaceae bacterium]MDP6021135.1 DUF423 domain-containing protein [Alphaproteobacteria bacterium]MDP6253295.1 DUF423 domain-containing protein [Alphaproteobacteria bacterium]MDP7054217.1 DUF423 domain-containing protein [Alphaproteobacteria bacterium]MDP7227625.1 DUF423 domain-containing protein [Alphaproteobacteria bacterium]|tara:strand:+ start:5079 stop:5468 length:390 start_codon:yes stop_codon:yes gene_type:complete